MVLIAAPRLGSSCVQEALPWAVVWFGSPRRNRQGSWGLPLVDRRRSLLLAGPPRGPWTESRELSAGGRARSLRGQERGSKGPSLVGSHDRKDRTTTTLPDPGVTDLQGALYKKQKRATCSLAARALEQRGEGLRGQKTGEEPSGPGERLQGPLSGRKAKPARTAQPRLSWTPGRTDHMTIDRSPSNLLHRSERTAESWS